MDNAKTTILYYSDYIRFNRNTAVGIMNIYTRGVVVIWELALRIKTRAIKNIFARSYNIYYFCTCNIKN